MIQYDDELCRRISGHKCSNAQPAYNWPADKAATLDALQELPHAQLRGDGWQSEPWHIMWLGDDWDYQELSGDSLAVLIWQAWLAWKDSEAKREGESK